MTRRGKLLTFMTLLAFAGLLLYSTLSSQRVECTVTVAFDNAQNTATASGATEADASAGEYERREDPATGRSVVVAGTYARVAQQPIGPMAAATAIPKGIVDAAPVIALILLIGGGFTVVEPLFRLLAKRARRKGIDRELEARYCR